MRMLLLSASFCVAFTAGSSGFVDWTGSFDDSLTDTNYEFSCLQKSASWNLATPKSANPSNPQAGSWCRETISIVVLFVLFFGYLASVLSRLYSSFQKCQEEAGDHFSRNFTELLAFEFSHWLSWTKGGEAVMLGITCTAIVLVGSVVYHVLTGLHMGMAVYHVYAWLSRARPIEDSDGALVLGVIISMFSLLLFALLVTLVQDSVHAYLDQIKEGRLIPVVETGHILIVGFTSDTIPVIRNLCEVYRPAGGTTIVLLVVQPKPEIDMLVRKACIDMKGSRIAVRSGHPHNVHDLNHVAAGDCSVAILLPERKADKELRDAFVLESLVTLCSNGYPRNGWILATCSLGRNYPIMRNLGGPGLQIVLLDSFVAKLLVSVSRQPGLGSVLKRLMSPEADNFYLIPLPKALEGSRFADLPAHYPASIPIGKLSADKLSSHLCPGPEDILLPGETLVLLSDNHSEAMVEAPHLSSTRPTGQATVHHTNMACAVEREAILIFGWNDSVGIVLLELDAQVAPGSRVQIFAQKDIDERCTFLEKSQMRWKRRFENISVSHVRGELGSRYQLEELPVKVTDASRIFLLSEESARNEFYADSCTVTVMLQIRDILEQEGCSKGIPIIPDIRSALTELMCHDVGISDFVNSSGICAEVLAAITHSPVLTPVFFDLISSTGAIDIVICSLDRYTEDTIPEKISFRDIAALVGPTGDVAIGWSLPSQDEKAVQPAKITAFKERMSRTLKNIGHANTKRLWELNPDEKDAARTWSVDDQIVVLSNAATTETPVPISPFHGSAVPAFFQEAVPLQEK